MKKIFVLCAAITMVFAMSSCKSKESAYKKAYEKAQAAQQVNTTPAATTTTVTPATTTTTPATTVTPVQDYSNVTVRTEVVDLVSGNPLKAYSVVVASMSVPANATALYNKLTNAGYQARVVKAQVNGSDWYRVVASSFDTKAEAAASRAQLEGQYQGAWLLYKK